MVAELGVAVERAALLDVGRVAQVAYEARGRALLRQAGADAQLVGERLAVAWSPWSRV